MADKDASSSTGSTDALHVGLIGCGAMGMSLGTALQQIPRASVTHVYDINEVARNSAARQLDARSAKDADALIAAEGLHAVIIAVPPADHEELTRKAAARGLHIFCEKPLALTTKACKAMVKECKSRKVILMVGHALRYFPVISLIREVVESGKAGQPFAMQVTRANQGWGSGGGWRSRYEESGGILPEINIHEIDLMRFFFGDVLSVCATGRNWRNRDVDFPDLVQLLLRFENGASGCLTGSICSDVRIYNATIFCTKGTIHSDDMWHHARFRLGNHKEEELKAGDWAGDPPYVHEMREFVSVVRDGSPNPLPGEIGLAAMEIIEAAEESMRKGKEIAL